MRPSTRVVIPHRGIGHGKTRLSGMLGPEGRAALSATMLHQVASACRAAAKDVVVISPDPSLRLLAAELDIGFILQRGLGMNEALVQARELACADGVQRMAVVSADLPEVSPADIGALLDAPHASASSAVIAPDRAGDGTNALVLHPPVAIPFRFGAMSRWAHVEECIRAAITPVIIERPGLAFDIDVPADLEAWRPQPVGAVQPMSMPIPRAG